MAKGEKRQEPMRSIADALSSRKCKAIHNARKRSEPRIKRTAIGAAEAGLTEEEAVSQARRCFGFRECGACDVCSLMCPDLCITYDERTGEPIIDLDYCKGCGICACVCPKAAIGMVLEER